MSLKSFVDSVQARTAIPGGGCVAALVASLGSALACMSAQLTYGNRKFEKLDSQIKEVLPVFYEKYLNDVTFFSMVSKALKMFSLIKMSAISSFSRSRCISF
jgi:formiminotetrahydrofolate cyclodeaminase